MYTRKNVVSAVKGLSLSIEHCRVAVTPHIPL